MKTDPNGESKQASEEGHLAALAALDRVGPARLRWLVGQGRPQEVWDRLVSGQLQLPEPHHHLQEGARPSQPRLEPGLLELWRRTAAASPDLPAEMDSRLGFLGVEVLGIGELPGFLAEDPEPPAALFCTGGLQRDLGRTVAIVGTRRASSQGLQVAHRLGRDLSESGVSVVSGLAIGIDAAAHAGALEGSSAPLAVIGAGHDRPCPQRNRALARRIETEGIMVSEVPPGTASAPWRYPVRNRLIAAFAQVVVVVESAVTGGSMSTVAEALLRDRPVMAVPGPLGRSSSEGCHELLRDGAEICTSAGDVLAMLDMGTDARSSRPAASEFTRSRRRTGSDPDRFDPGVRRRRGAREPASGSVSGSIAEAVPSTGLGARILEELAGAPLTLDLITMRCGASFLEVSEAVAELEASGAVGVRGGWLESTAIRW